jgi:hypothetical protein
MNALQSKTNKTTNRAVAAALEGAMRWLCVVQELGLGRLKPALAFRQTLGVSGVL